MSGRRASGSADNRSLRDVKHRRCNTSERALSLLLLSHRVASIIVVVKCARWTCFRKSCKGNTTCFSILPSWRTPFFNVSFLLRNQFVYGRISSCMLRIAYESRVLLGFWKCFVSSERSKSCVTEVNQDSARATLCISMAATDVCTNTIIIMPSANECNFRERAGELTIQSPR